MTDAYKRDVEALKLIYRDWDSVDDATRQARHHTFMFTLQAAVDASIVEFKAH